MINLLGRMRWDGGSQVPTGVTATQTAFGAKPYPDNHTHTSAAQRAYVSSKMRNSETYYFILLISFFHQAGLIHALTSSTEILRSSRSNSNTPSLPAVKLIVVFFTTSLPTSL